MDPFIIPAVVIGAAALLFVIRRRPAARTTWKVVCYACERVRRQPFPDCEECRSERMQPLSKYQAEGGGTGFWIDDDGPFVSSLMKGEWKPSDDDSNLPQGRLHMPLFDLDHPSEVVHGPGLAVVTVHRATTVHAFLKVIDALERYGLAPAGVSGLVSDDRADLPGVAGRRPSEGMTSVGLPFRAPIELVPSSTPGHFHLYVEAPLAWDDYLALMRTMAEAGLLEPAWVALCERRRMALLRKPGNEKAPN
jgi:hypothetical protein